VFLIPNEEIVEVELSEERKDSCRGLLDAIRDAVRNETMPEPTEIRARCEECEYRNYCGDIF
jgi:CRISPR-associated exonuclease Cas4